MKLIELFSEEIVRVWSEWEVRVVILLSLLLQMILIMFACQRKCRTTSWIKIIIWSAYMAADWVATVALGNLAKIQANREKKRFNIGLQTFWAPFLLLHLGGPDTITAYSLEDNELWTRHFLGLLVEVGVAIYVFIRSFNNTALTYVSIPIFVAGIIKYGERTYALRSASNKQFKEDLISTNPIVENAMRIAMGTKEEDFFEMELMEEPKEISYEKTLSRKPELSNNIEEAYFLFKRFQYLFANMILPFNDRIECYNIIQKQKESDNPEAYKEAFKLVEIELGFMYDVLYTKTKVTHTRKGFLLRLISFSCTVSALIVFSVVIDTNVYHLSDIFITLLLLVGAVFLEVYAFLVFLFSDWTRISSFKEQISKIDSFLKSYLTNKKMHSFFESLFTKKRWSASVGQYNLIKVCIAEKKAGKFIKGVRKLPYITKWIEECYYLSRKEVDNDMQEMIFKQLNYKAEKIKDNYTTKSCKDLLAQRGDHVSEEYCEKLKEFSWSTIDVDFDHSLLVWHIATDICYQEDSKKDKDGFCKISKLLSDYMLYLLFLCPSMLPKGIGEIRYRDTCEHVKKFLEKILNSTGDICVQKVCQEMNKITISKRHITQSILSDGCKLAKQLRRESNANSCGNKWEMISGVWIEMLTYAASHCGWKEHGQQLWKGGELLTHVSLLMAHLGLSEQFNEKEEFLLV
ncbi:uncharacterized protein LOC116119934 [Pistacia vera]|uniref:uncharacterized protein LOC116119934 n=1 Tax=Pistacia vera TaxID=55513 RepID=UPI00126380AB|nr:uncharacterized protein LOC116119934 [Pistacia vera]